MILRLLTAVVLSILFGTSLLAQTASINGYIKDKNTGETLIGANIALIEINKGSSTNTLGYFTITNIPPGTYTLATSYIGYDTFQRQITLAAGDRITLEVELDPEVFQGEEIIVESEREQQEQKNIGIAQIDTDLIVSLPAVFQADVFRSIQLLPGVKAASDYSSGLYIRGGSPDQTLILLDRATVYNPTHFFGFFSTFNPDAIKDVRLYKGGYPSEYGGRLGSVLSIYNKDGNRNNNTGLVSLGLLSSRAFLEGPIKNGSFMLAARRSTIEPYLAVLRETTDGIPDGFYFLDFNGRLNYDLSTKDKFSVAFYSGGDYVDFPVFDQLVINLEYGNQTYNGTWTHIFSDRVFSNFVFTYSRYFNSPVFEFAETEFTQKNDIYDYSLKSDIEYILNDEHNIKFGAWLGGMTFRLVNTFDGETTFNQRLQSDYGALYVQDIWKPSQRWEINGGFRLNYFSSGNFLRGAPRLSADYFLTDRIRLQAAYGRYHQFLTLFSNEAFSGFDTWYIAADGVDPAWGDQFVLGAKTVPFEGYGFDVEVYYRSMNDLFELNPFIDDYAGLAYEEIFRFGDGYAYGTEFFFEKRMGRTTGFVGYTYSTTWRNFPEYNYPLLGDPQDSRDYPPKYDRTHDVNVVVTHPLSRKWTFIFNFNFATGQAYTTPSGRVEYSGNDIIGNELNSFTVQKLNATRLPNYRRADISFERNGTFFGMGDAQWQFQIINVFNTRNVWFYSYDFDDNPVDEVEVPLLPILPSITYTVKF
ncbi:MAG: TonB-dependent receptor [Balneolales bacterium]|nr:TonB-dependent receptor [Balneolales bacterium]